MTRQLSRRIDRPEPGYFKMRLVRGGVFVPAKIIHDGVLWGAEICGRPCGNTSTDPFHAHSVSRIWESGQRVTIHEYAHLLDVVRYAETNREHPAANPREPVAVGKLPPIF